MDKKINQIFAEGTLRILKSIRFNKCSICQFHKMDMKKRGLNQKQECNNVIDGSKTRA